MLTPEITVGSRWRRKQRPDYVVQAIAVYPRIVHLRWSAGGHLIALSATKLRELYTLEDGDG